MNRKLILILGLSIFIFSSYTKADCLACWELKYVKITLTNNQVTEGYIKWSELWLRIKNPENRQFESFTEKFIFTMEGWDWAKTILYKQVYKLGDHLPITGLVTSYNSIDTIIVSDIRKIDILNKYHNNLEGAGDITELNEESIELLNKEPIVWYMEEGIVSETLFLSYNEKIIRDQLIEISEANDYWLRRKSYEEEGVLIIMISWD